MENNYSKSQLTFLVILRIFTGWHFLYEGMVKVLNPNWSASAYLMDSQGLFGQFFINMTTNPGLMKVVDFLNEWALVAIGLALILGCFARLASLGGILLLLLYTFSHPALIGVKYMMPMEGSYFLIDKNLVELAALTVLFVFPASRIIGIDLLLYKILPASFRKFML
ncbi:MAG: DoxX family membrane protein [Bacteroidota bacterium]